jgi:uncharacterized membrane protein YqjE
LVLAVRLPIGQMLVRMEIKAGVVMILLFLVLVHLVGVEAVAVRPQDQMVGLVAGQVVLMVLSAEVCQDKVMMVPLRLVDTMAGLVAVQVHQEIRFL